MSLAHPGTLSGRLVTLEPLSPEHHDGLVDAVRDGELWHLWYTLVPQPEQMAAEIRRRLELQEQGSMLPFTARRTDTGRIIGMTTFMNIEAEVPRVEIGSTWNAASAQGSGTNAESKLLLLTHAFEVWECPAVEFRTDFHNHQSRAAIARLGAKQDGILRAHRRAPGYLRDTVVFSITQPEWPGVRRGLEHRLTRAYARLNSPDAGLRLG
ncbi:GNAT family N-acetyltransferase [Leucobacter sp. PH1c]|uniref:GNAT family N-acetyltransferase n=1 Tax=Leucobacter sp. PH1c TaxID=1397278 RepID=UPI000469733C|nr:GNAT family protein [Leucobacter sp. PH1c]